MWKYLRYSLLTITGLLAITSMFAGGAWMWGGFFLAVLLGLGGDSIFGDDVSEPAYGHTYLLNLGLYLNLPLLLVFTFAFAWQIAPTDLFGVGQWLTGLTGYDLLAAKQANGFWDIFGGAASLGLYYGVAGTNVGHELTHRTWSVPSQVVGRWLLAFTSDASFAIEHVYGHHKHVATIDDPATARRGESAWYFVLRSTICSYVSAWHIERERLARQGRSVWSWRNKMHRGNLMTLTYIAFFWWAAGPVGALTFVGISLYGKTWLELVNYTEHYGLVRVAGAPVEPRHSWNCNRRISGYLLYNLTRHSHHHAMGEKPFWELRAYPDTPMMPAGYLTMIIVAMIPPLWDRIMIPRVLAWDARFATPEERPLIDAANEASGKRMFSDGLPEDALPRITSDARPIRAANTDDEVNDAAPSNGFAEVVRGLFAGEARDVAMEPSGLHVKVGKGETILGAALDDGLAFPHNCRVGGCATCKCKLLEGKVKQLTDASYILSKEDLDAGYILACQSVPRTDVRIEVDGITRRSVTHERVATGGTITALTPLTHDILGVEVALDDPIAYTPGQFAEVRVPGHVEEPRNYSFAAGLDAGDTTETVHFQIRRVDDGAFTGWLFETASVGDRIELNGPHGNFWLRPAPAPILAIAGGTGMAPLKALLERALSDGIDREVTYLFGARTQADLYCIEEMEALADQWGVDFRFIPVLSDEPQNSDWEGRRGMVTEHIRDVTGTRLAEHHVYMCGPPPMIEAARPILELAAVRSHNIHYDAFVSRAPTPNTPDAVAT